MVPPWTVEKEREYKRQWAIQNKEKIIISQQRYVKANKEKISQSKKQWEIRNPFYKKNYYISHRNEFLKRAKKRYVCKRGEILSYMKEYNAEHRKQYNNWKRKHRIKNPFNAYKYAVRSLVGVAVRAKVLIKQPCEKCGFNIVQAHHPDYLKPLSVIWLCNLHHLEIHRS